MSPDEPSPAVVLMTSQLRARQTIRARWREEARTLLNAHEFALSAISRAISRFSGRLFEPRDTALEGRMSLTAQFLQGVELCETAISEGLYTQAAALLKQEMETIEAIHEFATGMRRDGKTPRIGGRLVGWGPVYGDMNSIAHVSRQELAKQMVLVQKGAMTGPSLIPVYSFELAKLMYGLHVFMILDLARLNHALFLELYQEGLDEVELILLEGASKILVDCGTMIQIEPEAPTEAV